MRKIILFFISLTFIHTTIQATENILTAIRNHQAVKTKKEKIEVYNKRADHFNVRRVEKNRGNRNGSSISGFVNEISGSSYWSLQISLIDKYGYKQGRTSAYSSKKDFSFYGIYPGTYTLKFDNYEDVPVFLGGDTSIVNTQWFTISENENMNFDTISINLIDTTKNSLKDTLFISGKVYIGAGTDTPFEGMAMLEIREANLNINNYFTIGETRFIYPDSTGYFEITALLEPGEYYTLIKNIDNRDTVFYSPIWLTGEELHEIPTRISVPDTISNLNLHVNRGTWLKGLILDENGDTLTGGVDISLIDDNGYTIATDYSNSDDPKFSFPAIAPGKYYLKKDYGFGYADNWYYPGTNDISEAEKIILEAGSVHNLLFKLKGNGTSGGTPSDSGIVTGTALDFNEDTLSSIQIEINYENGNNTLEWDNGYSYNFKVNADEDFKFRISLDSWNSSNIYTVPTWYNSSASKKSGIGLSLAKDIEFKANLTLLEGGSIAGFAKDSSGNNIPLFVDTEDKVNDRWGYLSEHFIQVKSVDDSSTIFYGSSYEGNVSGGFRIPGILPGKYLVSSFPITEYYENDNGGIKNMPQPVGYNKTFSDTISVTTQNTQEITLSVPKPVSGMIKGTYTFDNYLEFDDDFVIYAFNSEGSIASIAMSEWEHSANSSSKIPEVPFGYFFPPDENAWNQLYDKDGIYNNVTSPVVLSQLGEGDYYIAILYWKNYGTTENISIHWYGIDSAINMTMDDITKLDLYTYSGIPDGAKTIKLDTDSSIVNGISFGSTPIAGSYKRGDNTFISNPVLKNGIVRFAYRIPKEFLNSASINVFSLQGKTICSERFNSDNGFHTLDFNKMSIANGLYIMRLNIGSKSIKRSFMFMR